MGDIVPATITAGLTLEMTALLPAYPAPDWSLSILLRGPQAIDLAADADGTRHSINVDAATTAAWESGAYWYSIRVTDGAAVYQVCEGTTQVLPDLAVSGPGYDGRHHAEKVLAAIEAVLENRATLDQQSYTINNRSLQRTPIADLLKLRQHYRAEVANLNNGGRSRLVGRAVRVRF